MTTDGNLWENKDFKYCKTDDLCNEIIQSLEDDKKNKKVLYEAY